MVRAGKRRSRRCLDPACGYRFLTTESVELPGMEPLPDTPAVAPGSVAAGRGYDREAVIAAIATDRRRALIARQQREERSNKDYEPDQRAPERLDQYGLNRELGR
jgi:hypothetical protein